MRWIFGSSRLKIHFTRDSRSFHHTLAVIAFSSHFPRVIGTNNERRENSRFTSSETASLNNQGQDHSLIIFSSPPATDQILFVSPPHSKFISHTQNTKSSIQPSRTSSNNEHEATVRTPLHQRIGRGIHRHGHSHRVSV